MIKYLKLNNKIKMPIIGLGTWKLIGKSCTEVVDKALSLGYNHIDTAEIYMNEEAIGKALKKFERKKIFITSKVWPENLTYYRILSSFNQSVSLLGKDYLDQYLLHWPNKKLNYNDIIKAFSELYKRRLIRSFGVSNFTIHHLKDIIPICKSFKLPLTVNQVEFHPFLNKKSLLDFCNIHNIKIVAYSPLAQGKISDNEILQKIGKKYIKTPTQITLRWIIQNNLIAIPKASSINHLIENLNIFDFELTKEDVNEIDSLNKNERLVNPSFAEFEY